MSVLDEFTLNGTVALVTGAASGIGRSFATGLAEAGARVMCADVAEDAAQAFAKSLSDAGHEAKAVRADVSREDEVRGMVEKTVSAFGKLDVAFANAGIGGTGASLTEMSLEAWRQVIDINLTGVFLTFREAARTTDRHLLDLRLGRRFRGAGAGVYGGQGRRDQSGAHRGDQPGRPAHQRQRDCARLRPHEYRWRTADACDGGDAAIPRRAC